MVIIGRLKILPLNFLRLLIVLGIALSLFSCDREKEPKSTNNTLITPLLEQIKSRSKLIVLTTNLPTTYYYSRDNNYTGPEYDMVQSFAKKLNVDVEFKVFNSIKEVLSALKNNEGDLAAAGLTVTNERKKDFDFGPIYQLVDEYLVCHRSKKKVKNPDDLKGINIVVAADTSFIDTLKNFPAATWKVNNESNTEELITQVANKKINCTISDSTLFNISRRYHTEIQEKFIFSNKTKLAWLINKNNPDLLAAINNWFTEYKNNNDLDHMLEKYYGYIEIFDYVDTHVFLKKLKTILPKYKQFFIDAAQINGLEPSMLAAQSYQESHWNRKAKSPTGVRGIMMLTLPVAKSMGVTNRLHAKQNIYAGAKFLAKMKNMIPDVNEPDRTWLALAAYNIGRGHFRNAQSLAKKLNKNPDRWSEMKEVLPLLSKKKYYKDLSYGYARGNEPVRYVERIRNYNELLHLHFKQDNAHIK